MEGFFSGKKFYGIFHHKWEKRSKNMAVAQELLREISQPRAVEPLVLELPRVISLNLENNVCGISNPVWAVRDEAGQVTGISGDLEGALTTIRGMSISRARRLYDAASAFQSIPPESLDDSKSPAFGDLYSDLSDDQLKLAEIVFKLEILNSKVNPDEYVPDQVLISRDGMESPIFRIDHATSTGEGLSIFFRKIEKEDGKSEYIKLGACSADRRIDAVNLFGKFGYQPEEKPETEVDFVESMIAEVVMASDEIQTEEQDVVIEEVEQRDSRSVIVEQVWPTPVIKRAPRVQIDPSTLTTPSGIAVSPFMAHLLGVELPEDEEAHTVFSRDGKRRTHPSSAQGKGKADRRLHGQEAEAGETILVPRGTFPWMSEDYYAPIERISLWREVVTLVDLSGVWPFSVYSRKLNGNTSKTDSLIRIGIGKGMSRRERVIPGAQIFRPTNGLIGPVFGLQRSDWEEARIVSAFITMPTEERPAYILARATYKDDSEAARKLELAGYNPSSRERN